MVMSWVWFCMVLISVIFGAVTNNSGAVSAAILEGAQKGITLAISIAGPICLWSGVGQLLERTGVSDMLATFLSPVLHRLFPSTKTNAGLGRDLSANVCANILGLGNAATPMGIRAAKGLAKNTGGIATDELCRLIVLNTASIQLIPTNVAALRSANGCATPFDILPAVWITSLCSTGIGLAAAFVIGKLWKHV